jgi:hypothetical protein
MRETFQNILKDYAPEDIFNCDKTGLLWKMQPNHTLADGPISGAKQSKNRVTVLLICNSTRDEKLRLLFIHKYKDSRALKYID